MVKQQSDENGKEQVNKRHNTRNVKHEAKKKYKKNKSKCMSMRAKIRMKKNFKDSMKRMSIVSERFLYKVPVDECNILKKIVYCCIIADIFKQLFIDGII